MTKIIAALDQGTTSTRCILFDQSGGIISSCQKEHRQIFPQPGWVEHDPVEIWENSIDVIKEALKKAKLDHTDLAGLGITNQRETTVIWSKITGQPIYNAIVWQDTRTDQICSKLAGEQGQDRFRSKVGLPLATYFSGPKIVWILENVEGAREKALNGELLFGTIDSWLVWNLTGAVENGRHVTDVTNASRTMLMDLKTLQWDKDILKVFDIPDAILPEIRSSTSAESWIISRLSRSHCTRAPVIATEPSRA